MYHGIQTAVCDLLYTPSVMPSLFLFLQYEVLFDQQRTSPAKCPVLLYTVAAFSLSLANKSDSSAIRLAQGSTPSLAVLTCSRPAFCDDLLTARLPASQGGSRSIDTAHEPNDAMLPGYSQSSNTNAGGTHL